MERGWTPEKPMEERGGWRRWISYTRNLPPETVEKLDIIYDMLGEDKDVVDDRYVKIADLMKRAEEKGLIKPEEHSQIRRDIGPEL